MSTHSPSILIVGAGAIGALFGSVLARQGAQVSVVCRSDYEQVKRDGYRIRSELLGEHVFRPHAVLRETAEYAGPPDYVILAVKVLPGIDRAALIRPAVGPRTVIVLIENGIDIEEEIVRAFPHNELLSSVAFIGVGRTAPGEVHHQSLGSMVLGCYPSGISAAARQLAALFEAGKIGCKLSEQIVTVRWQKALWNASFNPISIMGGVLDTAMMLRTPQDQAFIRRAMQEVCDIAAAAGHALPPQIADQLIASTLAMPAYKTSMAQDFESGRPLEIEAILGNAVRVGRKHQVAMPVLETVYALAKMIEGGKGVAAR